MTVAQIQALVAAHFGIKLGDLLGKDRHRSIAEARQIAMLLCRRHTRASFPELGRAFGGRDHTTVMNGVRSIARLAQRDPEIARDIMRLERCIREHVDFTPERAVEALEMSA